MNNNPNAAAIYFGSENNLTRYYPNIMLGQIVPADFQVTQRPWYLSAVTANSTVTSPVPVWSPVYQDATGLGMVTTIAIPVLDSSGQRIGVVGLDLTLDEISRNIAACVFEKWLFIPFGRKRQRDCPSLGRIPGPARAPP